MYHIFAHNKNVLLYIGIGSYIIKYFLKFLVCF